MILRAISVIPTVCPERIRTWPMFL